MENNYTVSQRGMNLLPAVKGKNCLYGVSGTPGLLPGLQGLTQGLQEALIAIEVLFRIFRYSP